MDAAFLFNSHLRSLRRARAARLNQQAGGQPAGFLFHEGAEALADRLSFIKRSFETPVFDGADFGALQQALPHLRPQTVIEGEQEVWPLAPQSCDLVLSNLQLHWVNDLPGLLVQIRRSLRPDGFFSACLIGGESLFELRAAVAEACGHMGLPQRPRLSPMIDLPTAAGLMQRAGFALPVVDHELIRLSYSHPLKLVQDLRAMGQTHAVVNQGTGIDPRAFWPQVFAAYGDLFADVQGGVRATFDLIFLSGWAPAAGQQKPLRPGTAVMDLAEGLKNV